MKTASPYGRFTVVLHWFMACWLIGMVLPGWSVCTSPWVSWPLLWC